MQMKTRSTTRAEASRLQVSTRSQARAAMAPPAMKMNRQPNTTVGYKRPRQKLCKQRARISHHPSDASRKCNYASQATNMITANNQINGKIGTPSQLKALFDDTSVFDCPEDSIQAQDSCHDSLALVQKAGNMSQIPFMTQVPQATPWTTLSLFSEDRHSQATLGLIDQVEICEEYCQNLPSRRAQKQARKNQIQQEVQNKSNQSSYGQFGDNQSTFSGMHSFGGLLKLSTSQLFLRGDGYGRTSVASRYTQPPRQPFVAQNNDTRVRDADQLQSSVENLNKINWLGSQNKAQIQFEGPQESNFKAAIQREKAVLPQLTSHRRSSGAPTLLKPTKQVKFCASSLHKRPLALKKVSDPTRTLSFDLYREEQLPWTVWANHSTPETTLKVQENDYDSDSDQIHKAQDKLRRDLRESINEEVDKRLQGLFRIMDFAEDNDPEGEPLSQRLRKRKLNSA